MGVCVIICLVCMFRPLETVNQQFNNVTPLVRPTYNQFEVDYLPPYGDPEVNIAGEIGTYVAASIAVNAVVELLD